MARFTIGHLLRVKLKNGIIDGRIYNVPVFLCAVCMGDEEGFLELINPEIIETSGEQTGVEGCLSVPGKYGIVTRPMVVKVRAQNRYGEWFEAEGEELIARCFCHELAHLEGQLYTEVAERMLTPEELKELMEEDDD